MDAGKPLALTLFSLHTGEVQGSIPCAPAISIIKSIAYLAVSHGLCPRNFGVQPGRRRALMCDLIARCLPSSRANECHHLRGQETTVDRLTLFGLIAVSLMLVFYALENRGAWAVLGFAFACALGSTYGFLQGAWPFGVVEAIWTLVALRRFAMRSSRR